LIAFGVGDDFDDDDDNDDADNGLSASLLSPGPENTDDNDESS